MSPGGRATRGWDAGTYDRVAEPQLEWARPVIERLAPLPGEAVLDAGCGSGRVTELIADRLGEAGRLIGVDGSRSMVELARERLGDHARIINSDLLELELPEGERVDAVFSTATFHWIPDHPRLFARAPSWLRPGGRIEAQCGGEGNIAGFLAIVEGVAGYEPYAEHLRDRPDPHHFAGPATTERRLRAAGFVAARCWLEPRETRPPEPREFISSVCLGAHLELLPEALREPFVDRVVAAWGPDQVLDYVRLNISARKPA